VTIEARQDFVRPEERDEYIQLVAGLCEQLKPEGPLEEVFVDAIIAATWRLRRCARVETRRAQSHNILRRSIAQLRQLQTERSIRLEVLAPNDTSVRDLTAIAE
jgi:hypothetical protein